jgi:methyl acetate hydrolase
MSSELDAAVDAVLQRVVDGQPRVPGVAAVVTDRRENLFAGAAGERVLGRGEAMTTDTVCAIYSMTKAVTGTLCLQLVESGELDLDAPAKRHAPAIGELPVLDGFDGDGRPVLRPPKRDVTTRMLLLHTAGFAYDFFNATYDRLRRDHGQPSTVTASKASIMTPLLFDPGDRWEYGSSIDWVGQVIEGLTGERLGDVMRQRILEPLEMSSTGFRLTDAMRSRLARIHQRDQAGDLRPLTSFELPQDPEIEMGGHGLYSTVEDYARFIRMWLGDGAGPNGPVLRPATVEMAARSGLGELVVRPLLSTSRAVTNDFELFPGVPKSWALTGMVNEEAGPTGRPAGTLSWAGIANLYYWIDRRNGVGGVWATQLFPFADPTSLDGYLDFETAVYDHLDARARLRRGGAGGGRGR